MSTGPRDNWWDNENTNPRTRELLNAPEGSYLYIALENIRNRADFMHDTILTRPRPEYSGENGESCLVLPDLPRPMRGTMESAKRVANQGKVTTRFERAQMSKISRRHVKRKPISEFKYVNTEEVRGRAWERACRLLGYSVSVPEVEAWRRALEESWVALPEEPSLQQPEMPLTAAENLNVGFLLHVLKSIGSDWRFLLFFIEALSRILRWMYTSFLKKFYGD